MNLGVEMGNDALFQSNNPRIILLVLINLVNVTIDGDGKENGFSKILGLKLYVNTIYIFFHHVPRQMVSFQWCLAW